MILKIMGLVDLIAAFVLILMPFEFVGWRVIILLAMYLLFKAYIFSGDFASIMDGVSGAYLIIAYLEISTVFSPIFGIYLLQKALFSF
jgi:hypothetical protein